MKEPLLPFELLIYTLAQHGPEGADGSASTGWSSCPEARRRRHHQPGQGEESHQSVTACTPRDIGLITLSEPIKPPTPGKRKSRRTQGLPPAESETQDPPPATSRHTRFEQVSAPGTTLYFPYLCHSALTGGRQQEDLEARGNNRAIPTNSPEPAHTSRTTPDAIPNEPGVTDEKEVGNDTTYFTAFADTSFSSSTESWVYTSLLPGQSFNIAPPRPRARNTNTMQNEAGSRVNDTGPDRSTHTKETTATKKSNTTYKATNFRQVLETGVEGFHMLMDERRRFRTKLGHGMNDVSVALLDEVKKEVPGVRSDARFQSESLTPRLNRLSDKNESTVSHELHDLIFPPACALGDLSSENPALDQTYSTLVDDWNEPWNRQPPTLPNVPPPQPDYCVGFSWDAFTDPQLEILKSAANGPNDFTATKRMFFPFLLCEVKSPVQSIYHAESQNAHNAFMTVRSMVKLFRMADPDRNVSGEVMAFSVSYNSDEVLIHAYYPFLKGERIDVCRRELYRGYLEPARNSTPWRSWDIVRNVYEVWAPVLRDRLCSAINAIHRRQQPSNTPAPPASVNTENRMEMDSVQSTVGPDAMSTRSNGDGGGFRRPATNQLTGQGGRKKAKIK